MISKKGLDEIAAVFFWLDDYPARFDDDFEPEDADFENFDEARKVYFQFVDDPAMSDYLAQPRKNAREWIRQWGAVVED